MGEKEGHEQNMVRRLNTIYIGPFTDMGDP